MADPAIERRLRRSFSHREKARELERECARAFDAGEIESARYASLREFYANHIRQAEADLRALRDEIQGRRASYLDQYRAVNEAQTKLGEQLTAGKIKPEAANRKNRKLMASADACRAALAECDRLLATTTSDDVGGPINLPLAAYTEPEAVQDEDEDTSVDWERALAYALPFLIAVTVFLPWLTLDNVSKALPGLSDFGRVLGLPVMLWGFPTRLLWVVFLVLPLAALPFAAMSRNRPSGVTLIICGFVLVWAILAAIVGLPMVSTAPDITLTGIIQALHLGPFLYFGGAIALIILGQRRLQRRELSTESGSRAILIMSACMVFLMVVAASAVWLQVQEGFVAYDARLVDDRTGAVNIVLNNEGRVQAAVFAPWPGGVPGREAVSAPGDHYGLSVHVRERGAEDFQLLTDSRGAWLSAGLPLSGDEPILISPRSRTVVTLAPWQLRALGVDPDAVRIFFSRRGGEIVGQSEHDLPELRAEPGMPIRMPAPRRLPSTPFPDAQIPDATERAETQPGEPTIETEPAEPARPAGPIIIFTGLMGDQAALQVIAPGEAPVRLVRGRDEVIAGDWVLLEIAVAPPTATLFHERTYETLVLRMGQSTALPE